VPRDTIRPGLRLSVHGRYNIYFRTSAAETFIVRVLHSARDFGKMSFDDKE
jgi:plasmid stabilization system protein ParE